MPPLDIAKICHEANRAYCSTIGDDSQLSWEDAEEWQRQSAIVGVQWRLTHPNAPESAQHEAWRLDKGGQGWKYGPVKDAAKKEHPCMVTYDKLPPTQQAKDALFVAIVDAMAYTLIEV